MDYATSQAESLVSPSQNTHQATSAASAVDCAQDATQATGTNGTAHKPVKPFRDDQCVAIMALPGYSVTDCLILLWIAKHEYFGAATCTALPVTIAQEMGGKIGVRTVQLRLRAFEDDGLVKCLKSTRGVFAIREMSLTPKFWALVQAELAKVDPKRYGDANHASVKRNPVRLETGSQAQSSAPQAQPIALAPMPQAQSGAVQAQPVALAPTKVEPARDSAFETANKESSVVNSRGGRDDDDDVRSALSGGEEKTPEKTATLGTMDDVLDVARRCTKIPKSLLDAIPKATDLGYRIKGDWCTLALAVLRLEEKIRDGGAKAKKIEQPLPYLLGVFKEIKQPEFPPGERDDLAVKVERLRDHVANPNPMGSAEDPEVTRFRPKAKEWITTLLEKGVPVEDIKPRIMTHVDKLADENLSWDTWQVQMRERVVVEELAAYLAGRTSS